MLNDVQSMHITISYIIYTIHLNHDGYIYKYTYGTRFCIYVWLLVSVFKTAYDIWIFNQVTISARAFQPNRQGGSHEKQPALRKVAEAGLQSHNGRQLQSHVGKGRKMLIPTLPVPVCCQVLMCYDEGNYLLEWQLGRPRSGSTMIQPPMACWGAASRSFLMTTIQSRGPCSWQFASGAGFKHTQPPMTLVPRRFFYH